MTSPSQSLLLSDLHQLLEGEEHTDVVLLAEGGQRIPAHSIILAARYLLLLLLLLFLFWLLLYSYILGPSTSGPCSMVA